MIASARDAHLPVDAGASDLVALGELDALCFDRRWPAAQWGRELEHAHARVRVLWEGPLRARLVGYSCTWIVAGEAELQRIGVRADARGAGIGRDLLNDVLEVARQGGAKTLSLEVASRNSAARALYAAAGFAQVGLRPRYYSDPPDDALILRRSAL